MPTTNDREIHPAEPSRADAAERLRQIIAGSHDAFISISQDGLIDEWNPKAEQMFGWERAEALGRRLSDLIIPERFREAHERGLAHYLATGEGPVLQRMIEVDAVLRDGREIPIELTVLPLKHGNASSFCGFIRDIGERRRAQTALAQNAEQISLQRDALIASEQRYRSVVDHAKEGIIVTQDGMAKFANAYAYQLVDFDPKESFDRQSFELVHPDDRAMVRENYQRRLRGEQVSEDYSYRVLTRNGQVRWLQTKSVRIEWEGKPATLSFLTDVTERTRLQDSVRRALMERETILATVVVGIAHVEGSTMRWVNTALEQHMLGYAKGELVGGDVRLLYADQQDYRKVGQEFAHAFAANQTYRGEVQFKRKDGATFWARGLGRAIDSNDPARGSIWIVEDVSQERELSELKSRFVSMTSHEFRTPLATILSSTQLLEDYADRLPADDRGQLLGFIKQSVQRMTEMLDDVLLIGRADSGRLEFNPKRVDLSELCAHLIDALRVGIGANHQIEFEDRLRQPNAQVDEKLLRHILNNLLSNAIKYSSTGTRVGLQVSADAHSLRFEITDQGIGIPIEDQSLLFDPFHRGRNVGTIQGTGLGLAIVKRAIDLHSGSIDFSSTPGQGTTFVVTIPIKA